MPEELVFIFIRFAVKVVISGERMELPTESYRCCEYLIIRRDILIRQEKDSEVSQYILKHGIAILRPFWNWRKITGVRKKDAGIYLWLYGYLIYLWKEWKVISSGLWCVRINALDSAMYMAMILLNFMKNMRARADIINRLTLKTSGLKYWNLK